MTRISRGQVALQVVESRGESAEQWVPFCGHCGVRPSQVPPSTRVCPECGLGLLLEAEADLAPDRGDSFLVLDESLSVCAVSEGAERLLATSEPAAVNRHVTELLEAGDSEQQARVCLAAAIFQATRGHRERRSLTVRPARTFGVRMRARVAPCGPQPAALLVFA